VYAYSVSTDAYYFRGAFMAKSRYGTIDLNTGELQKGALVWVGVKRVPYARWYMSNQDGIMELAKDPIIGKSAEAMRVFLYMAARLDFENYIQVPQVEIGKELGLHKQSVHRALNVLLDRGVISQGPKVGRSSTWRMNDHYGWKGKVKNLNDERKKRLSLVTKDS